MNEKSVILFPFGKVERNSRVILYGAGDVGQAFYWQIIATNYCKIVGWIDRTWEYSSNLEKPKKKLSNLKEINYDLIIIALTNEKVVKEVIENLMNLGVSEDKILYDSGYILNYQIYNYALLNKNNEEIIQGTDKKNMSKYIKIGFLAAGNMANIMAETMINRFSNIELYAVASRDEVKAVRFAQLYGIKKVYCSYEQLVEDPEIDLIYISTPVSYHYEHTMLALKYNKHVLCEKPFAVNEKQAKTMIQYAEKRGLFLTDGLWTAFLPLVNDIKQVIESGIIGKISSITANQHYLGMKSERLSSYELCGGALLEMGVYLLTFAVLILGKDIKNVIVAGKLTEQEVDSQESIILVYEEALATLNCGMNAISDRRGYIYGDQGYIIIEDANEYRKLYVYNLEGKIIKEIRRESGYQYEIQACIDAINNRTTETEQRKHKDILFIMQLLDRIRNELQIVYRQD